MRQGWEERHRRWHEHHDGGKRLLRKVYLHGLKLLVLVAIAAFGVIWLTGRGTFFDMPVRAARHAALPQEAALHDPAALQRYLDRLDEDFGLGLSTYTVDGRLLATSLDPPAPPLRAADLSRLEAGSLRLGRGTVAAPVRDPGTGALAAYTVGHIHHGGPNLTRLMAVIFAVLLVLAMVSWPLARSITRPVEQLTRAARSLGEGDLSVRTGMRRGDELGDLAMAFDEMADRIERLVRSEKELLANVSHELRTPMARIRVALELAAEGDAERARAYLREIGEDLADLERLVEDVMATARLDLAAGRAGDGAPPLRRAAVDGAALATDAADRFRAGHPGRVLELEILRPLPRLHADADLLRRAVLNLLDNARKYSDGPIHLAVRREGDDVVFAVSDRGIGIPGEDLERIFTPFFRTDRSRARGTGGVGLGLALVRRIAEAHGGRATARSEPGQGTAVEIAVPSASVS